MQSHILTNNMDYEDIAVQGDVFPPVVAIPCENNGDNVANAIPIGFVMDSYNDAQTDKIMKLSNIIYPALCYICGTLQIIFGLHGFVFGTIRVIPCLMLLDGFLNIIVGYDVAKYVKTPNVNAFTYMTISKNFMYWGKVQKNTVIISFVTFCVFGFHHTIMEYLFIITHVTAIALNVNDLCKKLKQYACWKS